MSTRYLDQVATRRVEEARQQAGRACSAARATHGSHALRQSDASRVSRLAARVAALRSRTSA